MFVCLFVCLFVCFAVFFGSFSAESLIFDSKCQDRISKFLEMKKVRKMRMFLNSSLLGKIHGIDLMDSKRPSSEHRSLGHTNWAVEHYGRGSFPCRFCFSVKFSLSLSLFLSLKLVSVKVDSLYIDPLELASLLPMLSLCLKLASLFLETPICRLLPLPLPFPLPLPLPFFYNYYHPYIYIYIYLYVYTRTYMFDI